MATEQKPTKTQIAEWMVQLNAWIWPADMPGKPNPPGGLSEEQEHMALRGAFAALEASGVVDQALFDRIWQDEDRRDALIHPPAPNEQENEQR